MVRFDYFVKDLKVKGVYVAEVQAQLNEVGKDGWELVSSCDKENGYQCFFFKRPAKE